MSPLSRDGIMVFDAAGVRDLASDVLDKNGRLRVMPAAYWQATTLEERVMFGTLHACYGYPTVELVDWLREHIGGRPAIEIGAGNGVLAEALGIPATDNCMQDRPKYRRFYQRTGQTPIRYGGNIIEADAARAIRKFKPEVVIGQWITHRPDPARPWVGGNEIGVDEDAVIDVAEYVLIGNDRVHKVKSIWERKHELHRFDWIFSRSQGTPDFIAVWQKGAPQL